MLSELKRECIRPLTPLTLEDARHLIQSYVGSSDRTAQELSGHAPARKLSIAPKTTPGDSIQGAWAAFLILTSRAFGNLVAQSRPPP
jgi:hypothetical protein